MRILACSDLHGDMVALGRIVKSAERKADIIAMAGDLTAFPRTNEIVIRSIEEVLVESFHVDEDVVARCRDKKIIMRRERDKILYEFPEDLAKRLPPNKVRDFGIGLFLKESESLQGCQSKQLVRILRILDRCKVPSLIVLGNDDHPSLGKLIDEAEKERRTNFTHLNGKIARYRDRFFFGCDGAVRKNLKTLNDWEEGTCKKRMDKFTDRLKGLDPLIFVSHCPPHNCLDSAMVRPVLTSPSSTLRCFSFAPLKRGSRRIGSRALRGAVRAVRPRYFVCGHCHANGGKTEKMGKTTVVNVATARIRPRFGGRYAIIDTQKDSVEWFDL